MRPISANTVITIEITNACHLSCTHCTRHVGHHRKPFFMSPEYFRKAVESILDSPCRVGVMGGEPTMHPQFLQILDILEELVPDRMRRDFWSAGFKFGVYRDRIYDVFAKERITYNDHLSYDGRHTPLLIAINDVVDDPELRAHLIENCSFQEHWSASITPKGGFFCEIAASLDWLMEGPGGYDISDRRWWDRSPAQFADQVERYCGMCSGAIPMPADWSDDRGGRDGLVKEAISASNVERLKALGSPKVAKGRYEVWDRKIDWEWVEKYGHRNVRRYRTFVANGPDDIAAAQTARPELLAPGCRGCDVAL